MSDDVYIPVRVLIVHSTEIGYPGDIYFASLDAPNATAQGHGPTPESAVVMLKDILRARKWKLREEGRTE